jgi:hypothetical protein
MLFMLAVLLFLIAGALNPVPPPGEWPWRNRLVCFGLASFALAELASRWPLVGK